MTTLGGPREGNCRVRSWLAYPDGTPFAVSSRDETDHGVMPWADFIDSMVEAGAKRPTFDLFDVPQPGGWIRRYRAVTV